MGEQVGRLLCGGPGTSCERCHSVTDCQIYPLNESGVESSREAQSLQGGFESLLCSQAHHLGDPNQLAPSVAFFHLTVDQPTCHLPPTHGAPATSLFSPYPKMRRQSIEVHIQAVTGEERKAVESQHLSQGVDDPVRGVLRAGA